MRKNVFLRRAFFAALALLCAGFFSCSNLSENSGSVTFSLDAASLVQNARSAARYGSYNNERFYVIVKVALKGDYSETKEFRIDYEDDEDDEGNYSYRDSSWQNEPISVEFGSVPVGSRVQAAVDVYSCLEYGDSESSSTHSYTGTSETITIKDGDNELSLKMSQVEHVSVNFQVYYPRTVNYSSDYDYLDAEIGQTITLVPPNKTFSYEEKTPTYWYTSYNSSDNSYSGAKYSYGQTITLSASTEGISGFQGGYYNLNLYAVWE